MANYETGHYKNIAALEDLIIYVTGLGEQYNPSNPKLSIASLKALHEQAKESYRLLSSLNTNFNNAVGERALQFENVKSFATQIVSAFKVSSKANAEQHADLQTINRKIQGLKASGNKKAAPASTETPAPTTISASQQSYDMRFDYFQKLVEAIKAEPSYNPNENHLKADALQTFADKLLAANTKVAKAFEELRNGRMSRDTVLYGTLDGIYTIQAAVKDYLKSVFKASSTIYKQAAAIRFSKPKKSDLKLN